MSDAAVTEPQPRRWRLRLRFGLRTFLIVVTLVGILLGWFGRELARVRRQREVVNQLTAAGATVYYDYQFAGTYVNMTTPPAPKVLRLMFGDDLFTDVAFVNWDLGGATSDKPVARLPQLPKIECVQLAGANVTDRSIAYLQKLPLLSGLVFHEVGVQPDGVRQLSDCPKLATITFRGRFLTDAHLEAIKFNETLRGLQLIDTPNVTDAGLSALAELKNLEYLDIYVAPNVSDVGVTSLARLKQLRSLSIIETTITDAALVEVGKLSTLEQLRFRQQPITDDGVAALCALRNLRFLHLTGTLISDVALKTVGGFSALEELNLSGTHVGDGGLDSLSGLSKLAKLDLTYNQVTDEGLLKLKDLKSLRYLSVSLGPHLSREGARRLKALLPKCQIDCWLPDTTGSGGAMLQATE